MSIISFGNRSLGVKIGEFYYHTLIRATTFSVSISSPDITILAVTKSGTGTWDLGRGDSGTRGRGDVGTRGRQDAGTRGLGDVGTWGHIFTICLTFHHISQNLRNCVVPRLKSLVYMM